MNELSLPDGATQRIGVPSGAYDPPAWLRSPHLQTLLASSVWRRHHLASFARMLESTSTAHIIRCRDGARLRADVSDRPDGAPLAIIIHGWLGAADSGYVLAMARTLTAQGLRVARLNLRDHGNSEHLNEGIFHSARIGEVIDACAWLQRHHGRAGTVLIGYSLGGNFALRVTASGAVPLQGCFAICPVMDPKASTASIDRGWFVYRHYFVRGWRRALASKQQAFPQTYDFGAALRLSSIGSLTDYFVEHHTEFRHSDDYFNRYTLTGQTLSALAAPTWIVASADDPMIPVAAFQRLPKRDAVRVIVTRHGGHCAHLHNLRCDSFIDRTVLEFLANADVDLCLDRSA